MTEQQVEKKEGKRQSFLRRFVEYDSFGSSFSMRLPDGEEGFLSLPGAICTIIVVILGLMYSVNKVNTLATRKDYTITSEVQRYAFGREDLFDKNNGLAFAAIITNANLEVVDVPESIGSLKFVMKSYSETESLKFVNLKDRTCTLEDFDASGNEASSYGFFKLGSTSETLKKVLPQMRCIDDKFQISGDYASSALNNLMIVFERC